MASRLSRPARCEDSPSPWALCDLAAFSHSATLFIASRIFGRQFRALFTVLLLLIVNAVSYTNELDKKAG